MLSTHFTVGASHPALRTSHLRFTLDTSSHLKSCELSSSHFTPSLLTGRLSKFFSTVFISSEQSHLPAVPLNSSQLFCTPESSYYQREVSCKKNRWAQKVFAHRHLGHRCIYTESLSKILCTIQSSHKIEKIS